MRSLLRFNTFHDALSSPPAFSFHDSHDINNWVPVNTVNHVFQDKKGCIVLEEGISCHTAARWFSRPCRPEPHAIDPMSGIREEASL
jgi:hypothetical protein